MHPIQHPDGRHTTSALEMHLRDLHDVDSDIGPSFDLSEEEVLSPHLVDFEAYRVSGRIVAHQVTGETLGGSHLEHPPQRMWPLVVGFAMLAAAVVCVVTAGGVGIASLVWLF